MPPAKKAGRTRAGLVVVFLLLIALIAACGFVGFQGYRFYQSAQSVKAQANEALADIKTIQADLTSGKMEDAQKVAQSLSAKATAIRKETDRNLWRYAEKIPYYGQDIATVRTLARALEDVSNNAIVPLCDSMTGVSLKSLVKDGGSIDVDLLTELVSKMSSAAPVLQRNTDAFNKCPEPRLSQLKDIIGKASSQLNAANDLFAFAYHFAPLLPDMLGANGTRDYLVIAQNNAETRATGGFYGSYGKISIDNGDISVGSFSSLAGSNLDETYVGYGLSSTFESVSEVSFPANNLYNMGCNPDVPHVAQVFYETCAAAGESVEGVFLVDPVFVQYLLQITGGFTASDGTWLDGSNFVTVLLHDTYWTYFNNNAAQDAAFAMVANDALHHVFSSLSDADLKSFAEMIKSAGLSRHISVWMADEDEQEAVSEFNCTGEVSTDETEAVTGIYFGNDSWSKMEYYLRANAEVTSESKNGDGSTSYDVALTLSNVLTNEEAWSGNYYVVADENHGNHKVMYQPGDMLESVDLVAPAGGSVENVSFDGDMYNEHYGSLYGNGFCRYEIHLLPGQTVTFTYTVVTSPQAQGDLRFDMTPLAQDAL